MTTKSIYHRMRGLNRRMMANYKRGFGPTRMVLLLTTSGRKSALPRTTPLQYEKVNGDFYIASARGKDADWFKNILANPEVQVQIGDRRFDAIAEPVTCPERIADFIELRMRRHPLMIRMIMHLFDRLPLRFNREELKDLCREKAMVIVRPVAASTG